MIRISKDKLYAGGVCFRLPDGFFINTNPESINDDKLDFYSSDEKYQLVLSAERSTEPIDEDLVSYITDNNFTVVEPVQNITVNNMNGYYVVYHSEREACYEIFLETPTSSDGLNVFSVRFTAAASNFKVISQLVNSEIVNSILDSIYPVK